MVGLDWCRVIICRIVRLGELSVLLCSALFGLDLTRLDTGHFRAMRDVWC
jgi:hypothetical protein